MAVQVVSDERDMAMWRFALKEHPGYGRKTQWELFKKTTGSERTAHSVYVRFSQVLLPNLWKAKFHVETKLMLCQKYGVKVGDEFLKELEKDAEVELSEDGTVNSYQLKPNCPKNRDLEMDDEEFMGITSLIPKRKRWTSEEDTEIWSYVLENLEEYTRGSRKFWKRLLVKMNGNRTTSTLKQKFLYSMVPNLHKKNLPIEQKLELYKRCQVPVERKYLKTLKEHAELWVSRDGCITEYKMKTNRPEKRKNSKDTKGEAKKEKSDGPGTSLEVLENEALIFDDIVPNAGRDHQEDQDADDDLVLDNVVDRGWTNPDMVIRRPPKIEVDDDGDEPAVEELDDMFIPKEELFDEMNFEYAEMVHGDGGLGLGVETRLNDDWNERIMNQRSEDHSDLMTKMLEIMQRMEQKMENQETAFAEQFKNQEATFAEHFKNQEAAHMKALSEMKKDLEVSHKEDMRDIKKALETSQHQVGELSKTVASMQSQAENQSSAMSSLQSEIMMIRNKIDGIPEDASARKKYLLNFKKFVSSLESPELEEVEQRIDTALQNLPENDQSPPPTTNLRSIFEVALTAIGH